MNVSELYDLAYWVSDEIVNAQIPQKYKALQTILDQHSQPKQQKQPFEDQKNDLIKTLKKVALRKLTKDQLLFLHEIGIAQVVGDEGIDVIEDILYRNAIDVAASAQKLQQIHQTLNEGIQKTDQIKVSLDGCCGFSL